MSIEPQEKGRVLRDNNSYGWSFEHTNTEIDEQNNKERPKFYNPTTLNSIEPSKLLQYFRFNGESKKALMNYNPKLGHFHYPIESMLKLIPFQRLNKIRWYSVLEERLKNNIDDCSENLEFEPNCKGYHVPNRRSIGRFFNDYMGVEGHRNLLDDLVIRLKKIMDDNNITYGERVGLDSTPLQTLKNDGIGEIHGHYYLTKGVLKMVKVHTLVCLDTGIPIVMCLSSGIAFDGDYIIPLLAKAQSLGFKIKEVYGDGHYDDFINWAKVSIYYNAKCYFNLTERDKFKKEGTEKEIQRQYQKFHKSIHRDWKPTKNIRHMLEFLVYHNQIKPVGAYFRNEHWELRRNDLEEYTRIKGRRELCENFHSIIKDQLNFEKHLSGKGWKKIEIYVLQFLITIIIVALIRAENDVKDGFMKISDGVFN